MIKSLELIEKFQQSVDEKWGYIYGMKHVLWSEARQKNYNVAKKDDSNCQNSIKYGSKWYGHIVTDCSGLFAWWIEQLGDAIAHGSNSIYNRYCSRKGTLKNGKTGSGEELRPGTAVFTGKEGAHGHIGLYIGNGTIIEAKGAQYGVIKSSIKEARWTYWGELKMIEYEGIGDAAYYKPEPAEDDGYPTIRKGDKNKYVTLAQVKLINKGYSVGSWGADGDFGSATQAAVIRFQQEHGLAADGVIGPKTWAALIAEEPARDPSYKVIIKGLDLAQAKAICNNYPGSEMEEE